MGSHCIGASNCGPTGYVVLKSDGGRGWARGFTYMTCCTLGFTMFAQ